MKKQKQLHLKEEEEVVDKVEMVDEVVEMVEEVVEMVVVEWAEMVVQ